MKAIELRVCKAPNGKAPFAAWFNKLERTTKFKVSAALFQMEEGNFSDSKFVGQGVWERRIQSGPGYRIYFAREKDRAVILLGGGSKKGQELQIQRAQTLLDYYRKSKTER